MTRRTASEWARILTSCGVAAATASLWGQVFSEEVNESTFSQGDADLADFLPNILHESTLLQQLEENLNYSAAALVPTFGAHRITPAQAQRVGRIPGKQAADQRAIANIVYGGDWGRKNLGNVLPDDGWTFRGRTPIGLTGRGNYERVGDLVGQNLVGIPDLAAQPRYSLEICIAWWEDKIPDSMLGETTAIRKRVNGGDLGLAEVKALTSTVRRALGGR
ncbi:glycoside hydrolase family 19 protein [Variovorax sp. PAMC26660]|uniref:glycoside hydrolase family 19 protein n=1 Tax=Variovorax sp. PAMC26660 TaxID=2762322 RepID=UPI00164E4B87|nr:glycoside hydrolase family 19 protein [Variovorax sp. PAMC26660]QNK67825.1 glycoside hydrolase family 19 protein [Variovorax sp. PAMC26660]